jgi:hypothetical protein
LGDDCHAYVFGTDNAALKKKLGLVWPGFFFENYKPSEEPK